MSTRSIVILLFICVMIIILTAVVVLKRKNKQACRHKKEEASKARRDFIDSLACKISESLELLDSVVATSEEELSLAGCCCRNIMNKYIWDKSFGVEPDDTVMEVQIYNSKVNYYGVYCTVIIFYCHKQVIVCSLTSSDPVKILYSMLDKDILKGYIVSFPYKVSFPYPTKVYYDVINEVVHHRFRKYYNMRKYI